jgi:hypothetical protein
VLSWLEKNPTDPNRQEAIKRARHLATTVVAADKGRATTSPAKLAQTSNLSAFLSGLTFRIPSFQLSSQGTWSSIGFAVGFLFLLAIGIFVWLGLIGMMVNNQQGDEVVLPVAIVMLALITYGTWLRFSSWATQRNFIAAYIVLPFFLVLSCLFGMLFGLFVGKPFGTGDEIGVPVFAIVVLLAIGAALWKIRTVR